MRSAHRDARRRQVGPRLVAEHHAGEVVRWMVGRELTELFPKSATDARRASCCGSQWPHPDGVFDDVSFEVRAGEIVALAGLVGSGRSEVGARDLRHRPVRRGRVRCAARALPPADPPGRAGARHRARARGPSPAGSVHAGLDRPQHRDGRARAARPAGHPARALRARPRARLGGAAAAQARWAGPARGAALRRQPAEGRAGQVARDRAARCSSSTSRPAASTSAPRPRCTGCSRELARRASPF